MKYYSIGEFSKLMGKTSQKLRAWNKKNQLKLHHLAPSGYIKELMEYDTSEES